MGYKDSTEIAEIAIGFVRQMREQDLAPYQMIEILHIAAGIANLEVARETRGESTAHKPR